MLELPEVLNIAQQLRREVTGNKILSVEPPTKVHKFCWWNGDPVDYGKRIKGRTIESIDGFGIFAEMTFDNGQKLCINDGVNLRISNENDLPQDYQLKIGLSDGRYLVFTVSMYGGIILHGEDYDNTYYVKSLNSISPFTAEFKDVYYELISKCKPTLSAKAFIATEQRFPGIGNGTLQDILFASRINPKRKTETFDESDKERLMNCVVTVLGDMRDKGGRDTETDIFGNKGGYVTRMSKKSIAHGCPNCGGTICKETYLGGSVYYCPECQPML